MVSSRVVRGAVILSEASLSFLGFGLPPEIPSWGGVLSREGRNYMELAPWLALWPGLALTITVYSVNMFGDADSCAVPARTPSAARHRGPGAASL